MSNPFSLLSMNWQNYIDIIIVAVMIYSVYIWLRGTRAFHILIGLGGLGLLYVFASWSGLFLTSWLLQYLLGVILVLVIVIFQPEIRQLLERFSPLAIIRLKGGMIPRAVLSEVSTASFTLADDRVGSLVVFPRATPLTDVIQDGVQIDSIVTQELLISIFQRTSPIHDGAVVIEKNRVTKAGGYLPLSIREGLPPKYGTRHRAAIGITENTDAICVVVSEERGVVSFAVGGEIETMSGEDQLRQRLELALAPQTSASPSLLESIKASVKNRINYQEFIHNNLAAKFLAVGLSCLLWFFLVGQQWSETFISASLEYQNRPADLAITSDAISQIQVRVRGPRGSISTLESDQIRVFVDLTKARVGTDTITITEDNMSLPFGLEVTSIDPRTLTIEYDRIVQKFFEVDYAVTDSLRPGLNVSRIDVDPPTIELRGPSKEFEKTRKVTTAPPINLSFLTKSAIIPRSIEVIPPLPDAYRSPLPEAMVSISLVEVSEEEEEHPISGRLGDAAATPSGVRALAVKAEDEQLEMEIP